MFGGLVERFNRFSASKIMYMNNIITVSIDSVKLLDKTILENA